MKLRQMILSILLGAMPAALLGGESCTEAPTIELMSYNIRHSTDADGDQNWPYRREHVTALLKYHDIDIICAQEARKHQTDDIVVDTGLAYSGIGKYGGDKGSMSSIFYHPKRFTLLEEGHFWLSETPDRISMGWDAATERLCCWVKLRDEKADGKTFYIFNVHMDHRGPEARKQGALLMQKKIAEITKGAPVIVTGDMNAHEDTPPIEVYRSFLKDSREASIAKPYGPLGTFNGFDYNAPFDLRIDYIFVRDSFEVLKYGVLTDSYNQRFPSDHMPVVARLRLK